MKIPKFLIKKRNIWIIIILVILIAGGWFLIGKKDNSAAIQTAKVVKQNLQETVLTTGQVVSETELNLSFQGNGIVKKIYVSEGEKVTSGDVLASLDQSSALAALTSAQGTLAQANANYEKLLAGSTPEHIQTVKDSVTLAQHDLSSAYAGSSALLNNAYASLYNAYNVSITMLNNYFTTQDPEGIQAQNSRDDIKVSMQNVQGYLITATKSGQPLDIDFAISKMILALMSSYNDIDKIRAQCDNGIYYFKVSLADKSALDAQKTTLNTNLASITSLQQNISAAKLGLQKSNDQLSLTVAPPTKADIDLAEAQILSAQGQVASAQTNLNNLIIRAPASGTITQVDIKVGEQAVSSKEVMILQDVGDLHAEADVSEANITSVKIGQEIDYTFDALGPDKHFAGKVLTINPASTVVSGVVNYLVKGNFDNVSEIKPGMTANMTIMVAQKNGALAVPSTAVIDKNNKYFVRVIDDVKAKTYHEVEVQEGIQADGGLIEIISGLTEGQEIVTYMK